MITLSCLLEVFSISQSVIYRDFLSIESFCPKYNINKEEKSIPTTAKKLVSLGLPSKDATEEILS